MGNGTAPKEHPEPALLLGVLRQEALLILMREYRLPRGAGPLPERAHMIASLLSCPEFRVDGEALKHLPVEELEHAARRLRLPVRDHRHRALVRLLLDPPPLPKPRRRQWRDRRWLPFAQARAFVRRLDLLRATDWLAYCRGDLAETKGEKPNDIPATPEGVYAEDGWRGMRDWLGGEADLPADPRYRSFMAARRFAVRLKLRSRAEWEKWCREGLPDRPDRPADVPVDPAAVYPRAFRGWEDFLGRRGGAPKGRKSWRPFHPAREFARSLGLSTFHEWRAYCRGERPELPPLPDDIPKTPNLVYQACGFTTCEDWLGTDWHGRRSWVSYEEAREFARRLGLERATDWLEWVAGARPDLPDRPEEIPAAPANVYEGRGWLGWGDFLGTGNTAPTCKRFRGYEETREFARRLGVRTSLEWIAWSRGDRPDLPPRPADIPSDPRMAYRDRGWTSWAGFLGTDNVCPCKRKWRDFRRARAFARRLPIRTRDEWIEFRRGHRPDLPPPPEDIPTFPERTYRERGWTGWADFLGRQLGRRAR